MPNRNRGVSRAVSFPENMSLLLPRDPQQNTNNSGLSSTAIPEETPGTNRGQNSTGSPKIASNPRENRTPRGHTPSNSRQQKKNNPPYNPADELSAIEDAIHTSSSSAAVAAATFSALRSNTNYLSIDVRKRNDHHAKDAAKRRNKGKSTASSSSSSSNFNNNNSNNKNKTSGSNNSNNNNNNSNNDVKGKSKRKGKDVLIKSPTITGLLSPVTSILGDGSSNGQGCNGHSNNGNNGNNNNNNNNAGEWVNHGKFHSNTKRRGSRQVFAEGRGNRRDHSHWLTPTKSHSLYSNGIFNGSGNNNGNGNGDGRYHKDNSRHHRRHKSNSTTLDVGVRSVQRASSHFDMGANRGNYEEYEEYEDEDGDDDSHSDSYSDSDSSDHGNSRNNRSRNDDGSRGGGRRSRRSNNNGNSHYLQGSRLSMHRPSIVDLSLPIPKPAPMKRKAANVTLSPLSKTQMAPMSSSRQNKSLSSRSRYNNSNGNINNNNSNNASPRRGDDPLPALRHGNTVSGPSVAKRSISPTPTPMPLSSGQKSPRAPPRDNAISKIVSSGSNSNLSPEIAKLRLARTGAAVADENDAEAMKARSQSRSDTSDDLNVTNDSKNVNVGNGKGEERVGNLVGSNKSGVVKPSPVVKSSPSVPPSVMRRLAALSRSARLQVAVNKIVNDAMARGLSVKEAMRILLEPLEDALGESLREIWVRTINEKFTLRDYVRAVPRTDEMAPNSPPPVSFDIVCEVCAVRGRHVASGMGWTVVAKTLQTSVIASSSTSAERNGAPARQTIAEEDDETADKMDSRNLSNNNNAGGNVNLAKPSSRMSTGSSSRSPSPPLSDYAGMERNVESMNSTEDSGSRYDGCQATAHSTEGSQVGSTKPVSPKKSTANHSAGSNVKHTYNSNDNSKKNNNNSGNDADGAANSENGIGKKSNNKINNATNKRAVTRGEFSPAAPPSPLLRATVSGGIKKGQAHPGAEEAAAAAADAALGIARPPSAAARRAALVAPDRGSSAKGRRGAAPAPIVASIVSGDGDLGAREAYDPARGDKDKMKEERDPDGKRGIEAESRKALLNNPISIITGAEIGSGKDSPGSSAGGVDPEELRRSTLSPTAAGPIPPTIASPRGARLVHESRRDGFIAKENHGHLTHDPNHNLTTHGDQKLHQHGGPGGGVPAIQTSASSTATSALTSPSSLSSPRKMGPQIIVEPPPITPRAPPAKDQARSSTDDPNSVVLGAVSAVFDSAIGRDREREVESLLSIWSSELTKFLGLIFALRRRRNLRTDINELARKPVFGEAFDAAFGVIRNHVEIDWLVCVLFMPCPAEGTVSLFKVVRFNEKVWDTFCAHGVRDPKAGRDRLCNGHSIDDFEKFMREEVDHHVEDADTARIKEFLGIATPRSPTSSTYAVSRDKSTLSITDSLAPGNNTNNDDDDEEEGLIDIVVRGGDRKTPIARIIATCAEEADPELLDIFADAILQRSINYYSQWKQLSSSFASRHVRRLLSIEDSREKILAPTVRDVAILYADVCSFTHLSGEILKEPDMIMKFINAWSGRAVREIKKTGGVFDKLVGDCVIALWAPPFFEDDPKSLCERAVSCAKNICKYTREMQGEEGFPSFGPDGLAVSVGINFCPLAVGFCGPDAAYTGLSAGMNECARLQGLATRNEILVMNNVAELLEGDVEFEDEIRESMVKNVAAPLKYRAVKTGTF